MNVYGGDAGTAFVHEHDETKGAQEGLYVPTVERAAVAIEDGTLMLAVGAPVSSGFETTWRPEHFERVPRAEL